MNKIKQVQQVGFGGGCHWCTEAVFKSLVGVEDVQQGYIASKNEHSGLSEAILFQFNTEIISLATLIEIHLHTHHSTSTHSMRHKYRSAVYTFSSAQHLEAKTVIDDLQVDFNNKLITQVLPFEGFKSSRFSIQNYYYTNPQRPFCQTYIDPKLKMLVERYSSKVRLDKKQLINS